MKTTITSKTTGKTYDALKTVRILNPHQAAAYLLNQAELMDIYASRHYETGEPVMVYLFDKDSTKDLYDKWCNYELK